MRYPLNYFSVPVEALLMSSDPDFAIKVESLSKCYRLFGKPSHRLRQSFPWQRKKLYKEFWALHDITFTLRKGHTLGVIGRNGSGKSTLLQLICGTLTPSQGSVNVNGRIGALLELGSGFNPEFTGLENVRLNAAVLGLSEKEIEAKLDDILAFADIGDFIAQPVKLYSSGMVVRLAFAVQAHIEPSILVVDEALAVGDELFQKKCFSRLDKLKQQGTSILLVSHSSSQINQHCDQALLLNNGRFQLSGDPHYVTSIYQNLLQIDDKKWPDMLQSDAVEVSSESSRLLLKDTKGSHLLEESSAHTSNILPWFDPNLKSNSRISYQANGIEIIDIQLRDVSGNNVNNIPHRFDFDIHVSIIASQSFQEVRLGCFIANQSGKRVTGQSFPQAVGEGFSVCAGEHKTVTLSFSGGLWPGVYFIGAGIAQTDSTGLFLHRLIDQTVFRVMDTSNVQPIGNTDLSR